MNNKKQSTTIAFLEIVPNKSNPRQEFNPEDMAKLEGSIKKIGIKQPLIVERQKDGSYLLLDGERRYRAAKKLGLKELPVIIEEPMDEADRLSLMFSIQEQHQSWTLWEKAKAVAEFQKITQLSSQEVADALGLNQNVINNYVLVTNMSKRTAQQIMERKLPLAYLIEIGKIAKEIPEEYRTDFDDAMIAKIDNRLILRARNLGTLRLAIKNGGNKLIEKFIKDPKYGPTKASQEREAIWRSSVSGWGR